MNNKSKECVDHFSDVSDQWADLYRNKPSFQDRLDLFVRHLHQEVKPPANVLDYGCGSGVISLKLADSGYDVTGLDGSLGMIDAANAEKNRRAVDNVKFEHIDSSDFSLECEGYDAIVCSSVIEYVEDDISLVEKLGGALKPGGVLLISVPHSRSLLGRLEDAVAAVGVRKRGSEDADLWYSKRRYKRGQFTDQLRGISFKDFKYTYFEVPILGKLGVTLSRSGFVGVMMLVSAKKGG